MFMTKTLVNNHISGKRFSDSKIIKILNQDLYKIALTDALMYLFSYFGVFIQLAVKKNYIRWRSTGWIIQNVS